MVHDFRDAEGLRLMRAFYKINNMEVRRIILAIAEAASRGATVNVTKPAGEAIEVEDRARTN